jgi:hypothetical protein
MKHLVESFQKHKNLRGVHFYDEKHCNFLAWNEVVQFINALPPEEGKDSFSERLADSLANYDPDQEYLAVQQHGRSVSVELYSYVMQ